MDCVLLYTLTLFICLAFGAKKKPSAKNAFPFPALEDNIILYGPSTPFYKFDGIDYDELPTNLKNQHYTCEGEFIRCIRNSIYLNYVCSRTSYYNSGYYYSLCQLEERNCYSRIHRGQGIYGTYYGNDVSLYQGEGWYCEYSQKKTETRRLGQLTFVMVPFKPSNTFMIN